MIYKKEHKILKILSIKWNNKIKINLKDYLNLKLIKTLVVNILKACRNVFIKEWQKM